MRYTTIIDLTEIREVYRSRNATLLYLHMVLKAGYHDEDRDLLKISLRSLSMDCGMTLSAIRCALALLQRHGLLMRDGDKWRVKKWIAEKLPTPRTQKTAGSDGNISNLMARQEQEREEQWQRLQAAVRSMSAPELRAWYDELQHGINKRHKGAYLNANEKNREWFKTNIIDKLPKE